MTGRHRADADPGILLSWIARSRIRIVAVCLIGAALSASGVFDEQHNAERARHLVATGEPTLAVAHGTKSDWRIHYTAGGRTHDVWLNSPWGSRPLYAKGENVTAYVSPTDPELIATRGDYQTSTLATQASTPLTTLGLLVILLAGPGMARWARRTRSESAR